MPVCCAPTKINFFNESSTTITYDVVMQETYGSTPRVWVYYYDPVTTEFYLSTFFTVMKVNNNVITVDHGGPNSGIIVIR